MSTFITAHRWGKGTWWEGRSGLLVPLIVAAFATYLLIGILTMDVAEDTDWPGPTFFPMLIMIACYILAVLLAVAIIRHPETVDDTPDDAMAATDDASPALAAARAERAEETARAFADPGSSAVAASRLEPAGASADERSAQYEAARKDVKHRTHSDFAALAWAVAGFAIFAALIVPAGWIISAAALFWCVARSMGSRRPLFDLTLALTFSSLVYLAFDILLGLNLPTGILGGGI
ncbi:tripartite tricarboxylate transporter TctB family protein [Brevibacterium sp. 50QC2O2]|uniref:tripartite tricarboxylate transporter TctB family protein n=1 Tax=Brevibacterium TaxID=1696 RepID=UPI00211C833A|nr:MULTISPECIES: tripartite tricarboxylate transporter TctB family protein [unclassified Brevibacterium]MCQ9385273.1 tripartite tricarboxylate transporter TctB family protein [Brevibacterium sp. 68QC2CO]MCQ9388779.1 tripartite tricarboxylate transporter TctB family protein [Brevibacterium sp. 50QC2O2]